MAIMPPEYLLTSHFKLILDFCFHLALPKLLKWVSFHAHIAHNKLHTIVKAGTNLI